MDDIPQSLYDRIINLLTPLMDTTTNRQSWVIPAFQPYPTLREQIVWEGDAHGFTVGLVDLCLRYGEVEPGTEALILLLETIRARSGLDRQQEIDDIRSQLGQPTVRPEIEPYRGLQSFTDEQARFFFGRERIVESLITLVRDRNLVAVVGNSGSGKSSLVRAGLIAQLRKNALPGSERWEIALMRPLADPLRELAELLIRRLEPDLGEVDRLLAVRKYAEQLLQRELTIQQDIAPALRRQLPKIPHFLVVIDQFEEIFDPRINDELRQAFIQALLDAHATGWFKLVIVLRSDFFDFLLNHRSLAELAVQAQLNVLPMNTEERKAAIEQPALATGRQFEAGLVNRIVADVEEALGDLPLLQFALTELWKRQTTDGLLTHDAYEAIGGVSGAIAKHAQAVYEGLDDSQQVQTQILFERRLVRLPEPEKAVEQSTRRRIDLGELDAQTQALITTTLTGKGLLITDRDQATGERTVELVHEALIQEWGQLQEWLTENQENARTHQALTEAVEIWERFDQKPALLYRGEQLRQARTWVAGHSDELIAKEHTFLESSQRWVWYRWGGVGGLSALATLLFIFLLSIGPGNPSTSVPIPTPTISMPANHFTIAVAPFTLEEGVSTSDDLLPVLQSDGKSFAQQLTDDLLSSVSSLQEDVFQDDVSIWGPTEFTIDLADNNHIQEQMRGKNIKVLVTGKLRPGDGRYWLVQPEFHLTNTLLKERAGEVLQLNMLGQPLVYKPTNFVSRQATEEKLQLRVGVLNQILAGISHYDLATAEGYTAAQQHFCDRNSASLQTEQAGQEMLALFCGHTISMLAWLQQDASTEYRKLLHDSVQAYEEGLLLAPTNSRLLISLAAALQKLGSPVDLTCGESDPQNLGEAQAILLELLVETDKPPDIPDSTMLEAYNILGHTYFWNGWCNESQDRAEYWLTARDYYSYTLELRQHLTSTEVLDTPTATAYIYLGHVSFFSYLYPQQNTSAIDDQLRVRAIEHYNRAVDLLMSLRDESSIQYAITPTRSIIIAYCINNQLEEAQAILYQFTQQAPNPDEIRVQILSTMPPDFLKGCGL